MLAALAHNLLRWTQLLGLPDTTVRAARTLRRRLLAVPGRLTRHARGWTLHLPARWPWHGDYITALNRIRALARRLTARGRRTDINQAGLGDPAAITAARRTAPKHFRGSVKHPPTSNDTRTPAPAHRPPARRARISHPQPVDRWIRA